MNINEIINQINLYFHQILLFDKNEYENELVILLEELVVTMTGNFDERAKNIRGELLILSEKYDLTFFAIMVLLIGKHINSVKINNVSDSYRLENFDYDVDEINNKLKVIMEDNLKRSNRIRLLDYEINYDLTDHEKKALLFHTIDIFQAVAKNTVLDSSDVMVMYFNVALIRKLSKDLNKHDHFYFAVGIMLDRFTQSQQFQLARDLAEEVLIISEVENRIYWGFFMQFKVFNSQFISNEASLYLLACLISMKKFVVSSEFFEDILINSHRFYRNYSLISYAESIYKTIISIPNLRQYQLESITCSHFILLIGKKNPQIILEVYDFLNKHRESIIASEKLSAIPWLNLIYSCIHIYKDDGNIYLLDNYRIIFENIIGKDETDRLKAFSLGESDRIEDYFIETLLAHSETRDKNDLTGEVRNSLVLSNKLISDSYHKNNPNSFLLAMILKSDHSLLFLEKEFVNPLREVRIATKNEEKNNSYQQYYTNVKDVLSKLPECMFIWLASTDENIFLLLFDKGEFRKISFLEHYSLNAQQEWLQEKINLLTFDDVIKVADQSYPYEEKDQLKDMAILIDSLKYTKLDSIKNRNICLFRDIELSELPHNLLLDNDGKLILQNNFIIDAISFDLLAKMSQNTNLPQSPNISLWVPTEDQDITLNYLQSKLEDTILKYNIDLVTSSLPLKPIKSNVTILIAHGDKNISGFPSFYTYSEKAITNIHRIVESTDILILFVCHSGSGKKAVLRSKLNSFVRQLLAEGIKTIIAPYWALHTSVPPIWLPTFLNSLLSGENVGNSFRNATMEVFNTNKNPGAWCCLHCYGNPFIKLVQ